MDTCSGLFSPGSFAIQEKDNGTLPDDYLQDAEYFISDVDHILCAGRYNISRFYTGAPGIRGPDGRERDM